MEPYIRGIEPTSGNRTVFLSSDEYFVLADQRAASPDSRQFGGINKNAIIGAEWLKLPF